MEVKNAFAEFAHKYKRGKKARMNESIFIAVLSLFGTLAGTFGGLVVSAKLTSFRLLQLEKKVDKHNGFAERIPVLECRIDKIEKHLEK